MTILSAVTLFGLVFAVAGCAMPARHAATEEPACTANEIGSRLCAGEDKEYITKDRIDPSIGQRPLM